MMNVRSRFHRTLKKLTGFENSSSDDDGSIGCYANPEGEPQRIFITEEGLECTRGTRLEKVFFDDIERVVGQDSTTSSDATKIEIFLRGGQLFCLDIRGRNGRFLDVYEWIRFLQRVVEDRSKR